MVIQATYLIPHEALCNAAANTDTHKGGQQQGRDEQALPCQQHCNLVTLATAQDCQVLHRSVNSVPVKAASHGSCLSGSLLTVQPCLSCNHM
jgi:hypothetical protein